MRIVKCPKKKCKGEIGRLNGFTPKGKKREYYIFHFNRPAKTKNGRGDWGTSEKETERVKAKDRCWMTSPYEIMWAKTLLGDRVDSDDATRQTKFIF